MERDEDVWRDEATSCEEEEEEDGHERGEARRGTSTGRVIDVGTGVRVGVWVGKIMSLLDEEDDSANIWL